MNEENKNIEPNVVKEENKNIEQPSTPQNNTPTINTVTTNLPQPQVVKEINETPTNNNQNNNNKDGVFKYIFAFIFLIGIVAFVIFLPQISEYVRTKKNTKTTTTKSNVVENGTLICEAKRSTDETDIYYEFSFVFNNRKLQTSKFTTKIESVNTTYLQDKKYACDEMAQISNNISGIKTNCNLTNGILKIVENYTHKDLDNSNLSSYTEAGGTYPEFKYQKDIYDIESSLKKQGYDCNITSAQ